MNGAGAKWPLQRAALLPAALAIISLSVTRAGVGLRKDHVPTETQGLGVRAQVSGSVVGRGSDVPVPLNGPL